MVEVAGVAPDAVTVVFEEQAHHLVMKGGIPWSERMAKPSADG
jgi:phenylpyruvate tautomerase PptA (4-oxalocrotonate tautomerase family)